MYLHAFFLALFSLLQLGNAVHAGGNCSFHLIESEVCNTSGMGHFMGLRDYFIDLHTIFDGKNQTVILPNTDKPIKAIYGNGLSKDQEKEWGGSFKWLPYSGTTNRKDISFEYNGYDWNPFSTTSSTYCAIGNWTRVEPKCGMRDSGDAMLPRNRTMDCYFSC